MELGRILHEVRHERGLSLEALSERAGVSVGSISQIERGLGNPAFTTLVKLAYGIGVPIGRFLRSDADDDTDADLNITGSTRVVRSHRRKRLVPSYGLVYELLTPDLNRRLEMLRIQIACGFDNSERPFVHEGEECVHLLSGTLLISIDGDEYRLESGDSITYDPTVPHWYRNPFTEPGIVLSAITPPSF